MQFMKTGDVDGPLDACPVVISKQYEHDATLQLQRKYDNPRIHGGRS